MICSPYRSTQKRRCETTVRPFFSSPARSLTPKFIKGDKELSRRLWDDVAARGIDPGRVINLMYRCWFHGDDGAMLEADHAYQSLDR